MAARMLSYGAAVSRRSDTTAEAECERSMGRVPVLAEVSFESLLPAGIGSSNAAAKPSASDDSGVMTES